jgi:hypothetical protein
MLKVYVMVLLSSIAVNADSSKTIKPEQYVALTGGTNGFGAKYSCCIGPVSMDLGVPFLILQKETKKRYNR